MSEPIRILHVLGTTQLGGAESRIMDLYRHMDKSRVQFDFLVHTEKAGHFDEEIAELGGRIYRVPRFRFYNYFSYRRAIRKFFGKNHHFRAVQGHITSTAAVYLPIARKAGVPITIAHARSAGVDKGAKGRLTRWMRRNLSEKADYLFTCSRLAGISVFGDRAVREGKTIFIPNAIDCQAFAYDEEKRNRMREMLGVADKYVIGHVGRFHYAKNHTYLLQVFSALCEMQKLNQDSIKNKKTDDSKYEGRKKRDYILLLLGEGSGMEEIKQLAKRLGIADRVRFFGNRTPVCDYYQAMDFFLYPSRYEGLPGTIVEAQTAGLRCLMSDTICEEVAVTELVKRMSICDDAAQWARYIEENADYTRRSRLARMQEAGFDVSMQTERMTDFYETGEWK